MANKYRNLQFTEHWHAEKMTADEVLYTLANKCGRRNPFFVNGRPYLYAKEVQVAENDIRVMFSTGGSPANIAGKYWAEQYYAGTMVRRSDIAGLEMVTVYCGREYVGRFINVLLKQPAENRIDGLLHKLEECGDGNAMSKQVIAMLKSGEITQDEALEFVGLCSYYPH